MDHDTVDSNPKCATTRVYSLAKIYKSVINHIFMINKITKKQKSPFFLKYKIENNYFITILGSVVNKGMMPTTIFC